MPIHPRDGAASPAASEQDPNENRIDPSPTHLVGTVPDDWESLYTANYDQNLNDENFGSNPDEDIVADGDEEADLVETIAETTTHAGPIGSASGTSRQNPSIENNDADTPMALNGANGRSIEENPNFAFDSVDTNRPATPPSPEQRMIEEHLATIDEMERNASTMPKGPVNEKSRPLSRIPNMAPIEEDGADQVVKGVTKLKIQGDTIKKQKEELKKQNEEMKKQNLEIKHLREQLAIYQQQQAQQLQKEPHKLTLPPRPSNQPKSQLSTNPIDNPNPQRVASLNIKKKRLNPSRLVTLSI